MHLPLRRIIDEKRRVALPVLGGLALNLVVYAGVVYPFSARVRSTESRSEAAAQQLQAAERDDAAARGVAEGRDRTDAALKSFYKDVLPANNARARQATFLRLAKLAEKHNLERSQRDHGVDIDKESALRHVRMSMSLRGDYQDIRRFIYEVESGVDFIVIDSIALREGAESGDPLTLDLVLSTYYLARTGGA
jgi:hypothetical protein